MAIVLIDLDGTLIPHSVWTPVFLEISSYIAREAGVSAAEVWRRVRDRSLQLMKVFDLRGFDWQWLFGEVAAELKAGEPPAVREVLARHLHNFKTNDGAYEALAALRDAGFRVEIATNGYVCYQMPVIKSLGLDKYINGVRTSDAVGCPKTCPQYFSGAAVMVGDHPVFDIYFPKKFGLAAVLYGSWQSRRGLSWIELDVEPDAETNTLLEVPALVNSLLRPTP